MKALIGLGNPEIRYDRNRHNIGFLILDRLAKSLGFMLTRPCRYGWYHRARLWGIDTVLFKPNTYMNASGLAAREVLDTWQIELVDLLVVYDDLSLPLGRMRIRATGGSAGHNGANSIISELGSQDFPRLRFGIGPSGTPDAADYVLADFTPDELEVVEKVADRAIAAVRSVWEDGIAEAMSLFNRDTDQPEG